MNRLALICKAACMLLLIAMEANATGRITIDGVQYETISTTTACASLTIKASGHVVIPQKVSINRTSFTVTKIGKAYFSKNLKIESVSLPETITQIDKHAFCGCANLTEFTLPSEQCAIADDAFWGCDRLKDIQRGTDAFIIKQSRKVSFKDFAEEEAKARLQRWDEKKPYETPEQYAQRVTDVNRKQKLNEFVDDIKQEYIQAYSPRELQSKIVSYDDDYGIYDILTPAFGHIYASVPKGKAAEFRRNYANVVVVPEYDVVADTLAIVACTYTLGSETFESPKIVHSTSNYSIDLPPLDIAGALTTDTTPIAATTQVTDRTIDTNIPRTKSRNTQTYAFVVGNERYRHVAPVPFAQNDARIFSEYCKQTLGMSDKQIYAYDNATYGDLLRMVNDMKAVADVHKSEGIKMLLYYAGHGLPNEQTHDAYLLPVDADGRQTAACYALSQLYDELAKLPVENIVVFMDACFSGAQRGDGMLASARSVAIKPKETAPQGKMVVFSAAQGDQTAYPYNEKGHGMFTYFLLKKLQESKGNCTLGELAKYIRTNVSREALDVNHKPQTPTVMLSASMSDSWTDIKLQ